VVANSNGSSLMVWCVSFLLGNLLCCGADPPPKDGTIEVHQQRSALVFVHRGPSPCSGVPPGAGSYSIVRLPNFSRGRCCDHGTLSKQMLGAVHSRLPADGPKRLGDRMEWSEQLSS
jgi:hypothetical protein